MSVILHAVAGCDSGTSVAVVQDTVPPRIHILHPSATSYDSNDDKLVDIQIAWGDSGGAIDVHGVRVRSLMGVNGSAEPETNLLTVWRVERQDSSGLQVHETMENLLHAGPNLLEVIVPDTAGNTTIDTVQVTLPNAVLLTSIPTDVPGNVSVNDVAITGDGKLGIAIVNQSLVFFDPESLRIIDAVAAVGAGSHLLSLAVDEARHLAYVSDGFIQLFDIRTRSLLGRVAGAFSTGALAWSRTNPTLLYAGENYVGYLAYTNTGTNTRDSAFAIPHVGDEFAFDMAVLPGDSRLYMTRSSQGGLLVINPRAQQIVRHISSLNGSPFRVTDLELSADDSRLYLAIETGEPQGVAELRTDIDSIVRTLDLDLWRVHYVRLSPSGRRLFVTTQDHTVESDNVLVDVNSFSVIESLARPRPPGTLRRDAAIAFRPDGKLVFVGRDSAVDGVGFSRASFLDVYLHRE